MYKIKKWLKNEIQGKLSNSKYKNKKQSDSENKNK